MKKKLLGLLCFSFLIPVVLRAQWTNLSTGTGFDFQSVDYYSTSNIYLGAYITTLSTSNGGSTWDAHPLNDTSGITLLMSSVEDLIYTSPSTGYAVGSIDLGNIETILRTNNMGVNWDFATYNTTTPLPRGVWALDMNGTRMLGAATTGRIFRSTDVGLNWSLITTSTTQLLNDVKFTSFDTAYACGNNVFLRSVDGGVSWGVNTTILYNLSDLACKQNVVYAIDDYTTDLIKSTNYGISFNHIALPFAARSAIYAINRDTVLVAGADGIYISKDGALHWEKFLLSGYQVVEMFDFIGPAMGVAVGAAGYVIQTGNLYAAPTIPISLFNISGGLTTYCHNDSIVLVNGALSTAGYNYAWQMDGITFSTAYNTGKKLITPGSHVISLITSNAWGSDTASITVNVIGHTALSMTINAPDSICNGTVTGFSIPVSQMGVTYRLRKGYVPIGAAQIGTGGTLEFSTLTGVNITTTYNIKATKTSSCFTDSLVQFKTMVVTSGTGTPAPICTPSNSLCGSPGSDPGIIHFSLGSIDNTSSFSINNYTDYSCCKSTTLNLSGTYPFSITTALYENVKIWIDYNGDGVFSIPGEVVFSGNALPTISGSITVPSSALFYQKLRMRVASDNSSSMSNACYYFSCGEIEDYSVIIVPAPVAPTAAFSFSTNVTCSTDITCTNTSYNSTAYSWDFGDGSPVSTATNPTHSYTINGTYTITLTAINPYGTQSVTHTVNVNNPLTPIPTTCVPPMTTCYIYSGYIPRITGFQVNGVYSPMNPTLHDYTCTDQYWLVSDSSYTCYLSTNGNHNHFVPMIDANNDGYFGLTESLFNGSGMNMIDVATPWGSSYFDIYVPANIPDSTPIRMRLMVNTDAISPYTFCSSYGLCGDYKDVTVFITHNILHAGFYTATPATVCTPDSAETYFNNTSKGDVSWLWDFGDGATSTEENPHHFYHTPGLYTVKLKVWSMEGEVDSIIKSNYINILLALPKPTINVSGTLLSTTAVAPAYQWLLNGSPIPGATGTSWTAVSDGNYSVQVINTNGCPTTSDPYAYFPPHVNFTLSPNPTCIGNYVYFNNTSVNCTTYMINWGDGSPLYPFTPPGGAVHIYSTSGTFTVKVVGCGAMGCDSMTRTDYMVVNGGSPTITQIGGTLYTAPGVGSYHWNLSGSPISGATSSSFTPTASGNYTVTVTYSAGCIFTSSVYTYNLINANFYADTVGYCGTTTASVNFINTSVGATSYTWDFGDGSSGSSIVSPTHIYSSPGTYIVSLIACNSACDTITKNNYITVSPTPFDVLVTPAEPELFCTGSSLLLTATAGGATFYQWKNGSADISGATSSTYLVNHSGNFSVVAINSIGCFSFSEAVSLIEDVSCVWPGDADNSYIVNHYDLLPIGLYYGQTGTARSFVSNTFMAFPVLNWGLTEPSGADIKHADCNGDGAINDDDTMAINLNYTDIHTIVPLIDPSRTVNPDIYCTSSATTYTAGSWVDIDIIAGTTSQPISNLYGIGFELIYNPDVVESGTESMQFGDSWLTDSGTDGITFYRINHVDPTTSKAFISLTRKSHTAKSGTGKLATLRFKTAMDITTPTVSVFVVTDYSANNALGGPVPFDVNISYPVNFVPLVTSSPELNMENELLVYPNPFKNMVTIMYTLPQQADVQIQVLNTLGETIYNKLSENQALGKHEMVLANEINQEEGIYFLKFTVNGSSIIKRLVRMK